MNSRAILRYSFLAATFALGILVGCAPPPPPPVTAKPVELKEVTIAELETEIASYKGKVVLIDVWFLGCRPCKEKMPQFVELHRELGPEGLVCMTLDVYEEELKSKDKVLDFLKQKGADTLNFIVRDEVAKRDVWQRKYDADATPAYVAFDRSGKNVRPPEPSDKASMTRFLKKLLDEK